MTQICQDQKLMGYNQSGNKVSGEPVISLRSIPAFVGKNDKSRNGAQ